MSPSVVQFIAGTSSTASGTLASPATAGSRLVLVVFTQNGSSATNTVTCGSMTSIDAQNGASGASRGGIAAFHALAAGGETSVSFSISGSNTACSLLLEISGLATSSAVDITFPGTDLNSVSGSVNAGNGTTTNARDYIIVAIGGRTSTTFSTWTDGVAPMTVVSTATNGNAKGAVAVHAVSSTASYTPGASLSSAVIGGAVAVAFKQASGTANGGVATETDTAASGTRRKQRTGGAAAETDAAQPGARRKTRTAGVASETDAALHGTIPGHAGAAAETDTAWPGTRSKRVTAGVATETDTAQPGTSEATPAELELTGTAGAFSGTVTLGATTRDPTLTGVAAAMVGVMTLGPDVPSALLYDENNEWLAALHLATDVSFQTDNSDVGSVSLKLPVTEADGVTPDPVTAQATGGRFFKVFWRGKLRQAAQINGGSTTLQSGRFWREFNNLPGVLNLAADIDVYPEFGVGRSGETARVFGYPSKDAYALNPAIWGHPVGVRFQDMVGARRGLPLGLSFPNPQWIAVDGPFHNYPAGEVQYFWRTFTTYSAAINYQILATGDNELSLWLDGEEIVTPDAQQDLSWRYLAQITGTLEAGQHVLAGRLRNTKLKHSSAPNPMGLIMTLQQTAGAVVVDGPPIINSDTRWWSTRDYPGFRKANALIRLIAEGKARKAASGQAFQAATLLSCGFTDSLDSNGEPHADAPAELTADVAGSVLDVIRQFADASVDYDCDPHTFAIRQYNRKGSNKFGTVSFVGGDDGCLVAHQVDRVEPRANTGLVQLSTGEFIEVQDADSVALYGRLETGLSLGTVENEAAAQKLAQAFFDENAWPNYTFTTTCHASNGPQYGYQWEEGDTVAVLAEDGVTLIPARCTGVNVTTKDGDPTITPTLVYDRTAA